MKAKRGITTPTRYTFIFEFKNYIAYTYEMQYNEDSWMNKNYIQQVFEKKYNKNLPIIFFDRDGTITKNPDFLLKKRDISFYSFAIKAIRLLNSLHFPIVVVTNQPTVARGWISQHELLEINREVVKQLRRHGAYVTAIFSCPHHPQANLPQYRLVCMCRKPGILLLQKALQNLNVSSSNGYIIGDQTIDIQAGKNFGLKTFLVKTGYAGVDKKFNVKPDFVCKNALQAVRIIIKDLNLSPHTLLAHR